MLLIIHNLPKEVTAFDVRQLIQEQCGLREAILDNLLDEGPGKRITVGLAEEEEAAILMRKLNGLHYKKCQLYVEDIRKKKLSAPSYPVPIPSGLQPQIPRPWLVTNLPKTAPALQVNNSNMPYYMTQDSNNMNFGKQTQTTQQNSSVFNQYYNNKPNETSQAKNLMTYPFTLNSNNNQASNAPPSFKTYQIDRDKQSDARDNTTQFSWRENKSSPSKRSKNFGNFSQRESRFGDKTSEWNKDTEVLRDSRDGDRSPPRGRDLFRRNQKDDRRDDFDSSRRSRDGDRSPPHGRDSFRRNQKDDRRDNFDNARRSGDGDRSPPHGRDSFRRNQKDDRRDDFDSSRSSHSGRSNPRDKEAYTYERGNGREQYSPFGSQKDRVFVQNERRNVPKRNYEQDERVARENVEKPNKTFGNVFETTTTFSSRPEHSFLTKPNKNIFDKMTESRGFLDTSNNKVQFPSPKQDTFKSQDNFSAPKRARFDPPQYFDNKKYVNPNVPSHADDLQKKWNRHKNWRIQSATLLAKEVLKNASTSKIDNNTFKAVLKKLRECIMSRLDVILGDKIATNLDELLNGYRSRFNNRDDIRFFKAVMGKVERENEEKAAENTGPSVGKEKQQHQDIGKLNKGPSVVNPFYSPRPNVNLPKQQQYSGKFNKGPNLVNPFYSPRPQLTMKPNLGTAGKQKGIVPPKRPFMKDPKTMPRLPKYPNSDKKIYKQSQKTALLEYDEGFYIMEPDFERAVNEEVEKLFECYVEACKPPEPTTNEDENNIRNKIITSTADEFKKIIKLDVTKRILGVTDGLTVRIFSTPYAPPRVALDAFLQKHGAVNLKKADTKKMFLANCDSYESYDKLLALKTASFGHITIHFKPFQVLGPVTKKNKKANQATAANPGEGSTKDVDELEIDLTADINDDADVVLVENENSEVVVIRDDLDKSSAITSNIVDIENDKGKEINDLKLINSNDKVDDTNNKIAAFDVKIAASYEKVCNSNDKDDYSNEKINISKEKVNKSDYEVKDFEEKIEDSIDKVQNSQSEDLIESETKVLESLNDEVDEILEEDLEDF